MHGRLCLALVACATLALGSVRCGSKGGSAACDTEAHGPYWAYLLDAICTDDEEIDCLEPTTYVATRSDGRQVTVAGVYRWRHPNARWAEPGVGERDHLLPHFVLQYMRKLRNAYEACPTDELYTRLYNQIDYLISQAVEYGPTGDAVLPPLVWENRYGVAHAMEQAEMAAFLASAAGAYAKHGAREAAETMRYAFQAMESLFVPVGVGTGGVRSVVQDECGAKVARFRRGYWFHSRGVGVDTADEDLIPTVLNQHLHAIADTLEMYVAVSDHPELVPVEYGSAQNALARLEDRAIGGLYQLAFSNGNNSAAPMRPPSMVQFMRHDTTGEWPFYFSWYRFDLSDRTFRNIDHYLTCLYHTHSLKVLSNIRAMLDGRYVLFANSPSGEGWRLYEAVDRLFADGGEPMGVAGSTSAIWQFWLSHNLKYEIEGCPHCTDKNGKITECPDDAGVVDLFPHGWSWQQ